MIARFEPMSLRPWLRDLLIMSALMILILAAFIDVKNCGFLNYDDPLYVTDNPHVQAGLSRQGVRWAFTTQATANYHPLTWLSLMLDRELTRPGLVNPALVFHLTNLALHVANAWLVFLILRTMTGSVWRSALVAALFSLHPLRVESVAWVSERKDVLSACLGLLALLAYARYARRPRWGPYLLTWFLYCLSLLSKPMLVSFPFLLLLLDFWPLRRWPLTFDVNERHAQRMSSCAVGRDLDPEHGRPRDRNRSAGRAAPLYDPKSTATTAISHFSTRPLSFLLLEKLPLLALSAAMCAVTFFVQQQGGSVRTTSEVAIAARLANLPVAYARYLGKMVWFHNLAVDYPYPRAWPVAAVIAAVMALVAVTALALWRIRWEPWLAVGWFWFLGMLAPVIGLVQVGNQSMADRYTYLPMIGILILAVWSLPARSLTLPLARLLAVLAAALVLAVLCRFTQIQVGYWENTVSLMTHALEVTNGNYLAEYDLAAALGTAGDVDGAVEHYGKAVALKPQSAVLHNSYGLALAMAGNAPAAAAEYRKSLSLDPNLPEALNNLGFLLACPGPLHDRHAAIEDYLHALRIRPTYADAQVNLGLALTDMGDRSGAIHYYQLALQNEPDHANAHFNLGLILLKEGQSSTALEHLREAVRLRPQDPHFQQTLEEALKVAGLRGH